MGYFAAMSDWNQSGRDDRYDRIANRGRYRRFAKEDKEYDDWAFEEKDYEFDEY